MAPTVSHMKLERKYGKQCGPSLEMEAWSSPTFPLYKLQITRAIGTKDWWATI